jgi:ABC-2 type transport system permease protein
MQSFWALLRAGFLTRASYRVGFVLSVIALAFQAVPMFYIARALQPFMDAPGRLQGTPYFAWLVLGTVAFVVLVAALDSLPRAIENGLITGQLEALLSTPASTGTLFAGLASADIVWAAIKAFIFLLCGAVLGARFHWAHVPLGLLVLGLLVLSTVPFGIVAASFLIAFRRAGPLQTLVVLLSQFLGGIYYPVNMIPTWVEDLSRALPVTYALRAFRGVLIDGRGLREVAPDLGILVAITAVLLAASILCLRVSLRYARRSGSLAQY